MSVRVAVEEVKDASEIAGGEGGTEACGSSDHSSTGVLTSICSERVSTGCCIGGSSEACLVGSPCLHDWRMTSRLWVSSQWSMYSNTRFLGVIPVGMSSRVPWSSSDRAVWCNEVSLEVVLLPCFSIVSDKFVLSKTTRPLKLSTFLELEATPRCRCRNSVCTSVAKPLVLSMRALLARSWRSRPAPKDVWRV